MIDTMMRMNKNGACARSRSWIRVPTLVLLILSLLNFGVIVSAFQQQQQQQQQYQQRSPSYSMNSIQQQQQQQQQQQHPRSLAVLRAFERTTVRHMILSSSSSSSSSSVTTSVTTNDGGGVQQQGSTKTTTTTKFEKQVSKLKIGLGTFIRIAVPAIVSGIVAFYAFPKLALGLGSLFTEAGVFAVLSQDSSQFVQNFLSVCSLLFSILVGQTYYFMYQQQEMVYYALFDEVTEAKSLLEQVALVSQGRKMYGRVLQCMSTYVQSDLKALDKDPALLLSSRPMDDPLETIMYLTSVGVPSTVYETIKSLRCARSRRLGALQRKLPPIHMMLLWTLALLELISFPLLGAGTQTIGGYNLLTVEGVLFGVMTAAVVGTMRVVGELWRMAGGAYSIDAVLTVMVSGLEQELVARQQGLAIQAQRGNFPSTTEEYDYNEERK